MIALGWLCPASLQRLTTLPVGLRTPAGDLTALGPDRATSSGTDANFRDLNLKLKKLHVDHDKLAKWVTESVGGLHEEQVGLAEQVSKLRSGRGYQAVNRPAEPDSSQDWHEAIEEVHQKIQDLSRGFHRQRRDHDNIVEKVETANSRIAAYEASSRNLQQVIEDIRRQVCSLPSGNEQTQSVVRRELASYRNSLDATMRRVTTVESNVHTLNGMNNRVMAQLAEIEGHVDEAADIIQGVSRILVDSERGRMLGTTLLLDRDTGSGRRHLPLGKDMFGVPILWLGRVGALA